MEDSHILIDDMKKAYPDRDVFNHGERYSLYCVFDGHGGDRSAIICEEKVPGMLVAQKEFADGNFLEAISKTFYEVDDYIKDNERSYRTAGTTAVAILIVDTTLYCGNLGDSEAIIGDLTVKGKVHEVTHAHRASDPSEKERVEEAGGTAKSGRIQGSLAVSRTIGDWDYKIPHIPDGHKDYVSREPHLLKFDLTETNEYLIIACDGLWDVATFKRAHDIVMKSLKKSSDPADACAVLIRESLERSSSDNVTVLVVFFDWK